MTTINSPHRQSCHVIMYIPLCSTENSRTTSLCYFFYPCTTPYHTISPRAIPANPPANLHDNLQHNLQGSQHIALPFGMQIPRLAPLLDSQVLGPASSLPVIKPPLFFQIKTFRNFTITHPNTVKTEQPSNQPTRQPSSMPTRPSSQPSRQPTTQVLLLLFYYSYHVCRKCCCHTIANLILSLDPLS